MGSSSMIKAICFDLDGVYFDDSGFQLFKDTLVELGASRETVTDCFHGGSMDQFKRGELSEDEYWQSTLRSLGINISAPDIQSLMVKHYNVNPEVRTLVLMARQAGYKTCVCSNNFTTRISKLNEKFNFLEDFDFSVFSYEVGELKPSPVIFKELLLRANVKPDELVYSDDNSDKLAGAQELGINTFTFTNIDQFKDELTKLGVAL